MRIASSITIGDSLYTQIYFLTWIPLRYFTFSAWDKMQKGITSKGMGCGVGPNLCLNTSGSERVEDAQRT